MSNLHGFPPAESSWTAFRGVGSRTSINYTVEPCGIELLYTQTSLLDSTDRGGSQPIAWGRVLGCNCRAEEFALYGWGVVVLWLTRWSPSGPGQKPYGFRIWAVY